METERHKETETKKEMTETERETNRQTARRTDRQTCVECLMAFHADIPVIRKSLTVIVKASQISWQPLSVRLIGRPLFRLRRDSRHSNLSSHRTPSTVWRAARTLEPGDLVLEYASRV